MSIEYTEYFADDVTPDGPSDSELFDMIDEEEVVEDEITMMGKVYNTQKVYLREKPTKESKHIAILDKGDEVMIDGTVDDEFGNGWYHLITASGNEGYMMAEFVKIVE